MLLYRTYCHVSLPAFSPISVMTSWPTWAAMAGGHNRRGPTWGVGHARRSWNVVRDDYPRPSLTGNAARALPSAAFVAARCEPFSVNSLPPGPSTCPAWPSATSASARCEPFLVNSLLPEPSACPAWPSAASVTSRCEPIPAFPLLPGPSTHPVWPFAASAASRCEPILAFSLLPGPPTCPAKPSAAPVASRCEPFPTNRLTPSSRDSGIPARHYGSGRLRTGSLRRCFCVEQEAARSRRAAQQDISAVPYR